MQIPTCIQTYIHSCIQTYIHTCICIVIPTRILTRILARIPTCIPTRIQTCFHTWIRHSFMRHSYAHNVLRWSILWEGTVPVGSNSTTGATVAVAVAADTGLSGFGRLRYYCFQQAKRERALGFLNGTLLHCPYHLFGSHSFWSKVCFLVFLSNRIVFFIAIDQKRSQKT